MPLHPLSRHQLDSSRSTCIQWEVLLWDLEDTSLDSCNGRDSAVERRKMDPVRFRCNFGPKRGQNVCVWSKIFRSQALQILGKRATSEQIPRNYEEDTEFSFLPACCSIFHDHWLGHKSIFRFTNKQSGWIRRTRVGTETESIARRSSCCRRSSRWSDHVIGWKLFFKRNTSLRCQLFPTSWSERFHITDVLRCISF